RVFFDLHHASRDFVLQLGVDPSPFEEPLPAGPGQRAGRHDLAIFGAESQTPDVVTVFRIGVQDGFLGGGQPRQTVSQRTPTFGSERALDLNLRIASPRHFGAKGGSVHMNELPGPEIRAGPFCVRQIDRERPSAIGGYEVGSSIRIRADRILGRTGRLASRWFSISNVPKMGSSM